MKRTDHGIPGCLEIINIPDGLFKQFFLLLGTVLVILNFIGKYNIEQFTADRLEHDIIKIADKCRQMLILRVIVDDLFVGIVYPEITDTDRCGFRQISGLLSCCYHLCLTHIQSVFISAVHGDLSAAGAGVVNNVIMYQHARLENFECQCQHIALRRIAGRLPVHMDGNLVSEIDQHASQHFTARVEVRKILTERSDNRIRLLSHDLVVSVGLFRQSVQGIAVECRECREFFSYFFLCHTFPSSTKRSFQVLLA